MRIKKFVADSMPEALKQVKADLGAGAVILNTRTLSKSGAFGIGGKGSVEVTAAVDSDPIPKGTGKKPSPALPPRGAGPGPTAVPPRKPAGAPAPDSGWADLIARKLDGLEAVLRAGPKANPEKLLLPGALGALSDQLESAGLPQILSQDMLKNLLMDPGPTGLKDLASLKSRAAEMLARWFESPAPTRLGKGVRSVVALVGPAGVGKTTAVARLAAHFSSENGARVLMVAADTDRVGGLEQIRAYAGILNLPLEVAYTPEDLGDVIRNRREFDLLLVDTAGVGPLAQNQLAGLQALLKEAAPNEIHLTLSATSDLGHMRDVLAAFAPLGTNRLLLTKLDETARLGPACALAVESKLPLSYTTHGRAIPGDLQTADLLALAQDLLERAPHAC